MAKASATTKTRRRTTSSAAKVSPSPSTKSAVTIRHYCQGIGDCHLLRFTKADGSDFWMLIDCGIHSSVSGGADKIDKIVADIATQTKKRLDVIAITHEHTDHLSGFLSAAERFKEFSVGEVWMAWTENPSDPQAQELDKFKSLALSALQMTAGHLDRAAGLSPHLSALRAGVNALLGFSIGAKGQRVRAMRDAAQELGKGPVRYCEPRNPPIMIAGLPGLRIYVLGPPRDPKSLGVMKSASEMYLGVSGSAWRAAEALSGALAASETDDDDSARPFDSEVGSHLDNIDPKIAAFARDHYFGPAPSGGHAIRLRQRKRTADPNEHDQSWRRIDSDWLSLGADLAMQIDDKTNNTSLVLAFEFIDTKRVLLFAADAQVGNWLSWQEAKWTVDGQLVNGPDLLSRTVYYKVGHHGSQNATLREHGLELMESRDLSAFIPTNEHDAQNVGWGQMPFDKLLKALTSRCGSRVIRADDAWVLGNAPSPGFEAPSGSIQALRHQPGLWVEVELS